MTPFFSVVIPTYNRAKRVAAAVRSVLAQTEGGWECFVIDDGSTDGTKAALSPYNDSRLRMIFNEKNRGQHACRNQAIGLSSAPWVAFLDSDDLFMPERLAQLRRAIESRPSIGFWFTNAWVCRYGRVIGTLFDPARQIPQGRVPGWYAVGDEFLPYVTSTVAIRREAFDRTGLFREDLRILEDTELYGRMLAGGLEVGALNQPLVARFLHETQITRDHRKDFEESMEALRSAGAPSGQAMRVRRRVACQVAEFLWRDLQPAAAREFLRRELPGERGWMYWKTFAPAQMLGALKRLRETYLKARHHPALASHDRSEAARVIERLV